MSELVRNLADVPDPFDNLLGYHLRRLSLLTMADLATALAPLGLTPAGASVLFAVGANGGITQSELGKMLGILRANMTPLIARLMTEGLLERERKDGRSQALRLTQAGLKSRRLAWKTTQQHEQRMFGALSAQAREKMVMQLRSLWQACTSDVGIEG